MKKKKLIATIVVLSIIIILVKIYLVTNIPKVDFKVENIELLPHQYYKNYSEITLTLSSKEDFIKIYNEEHAVNIYMFCPLTTSDFSAKNISSEMFRLEDASFRHDTTVQIGDRFFYKFPIMFSNKDGKKINKITALELLKKRDCVECEIVMAFFPGKIVRNQTSNPFCISADSLIKFLK